ncbi:MAG: pentapeptide repeat-containing protein [Rhodothermales bacterium]
MANTEHIQLLESGAASWNAWRKEQPDLIPDLSGADLTGRWLQEYNLSRANLKGAFLTV